MKEAGEWVSCPVLHPPTSHTSVGCHLAPVTGEGTEA
jgi:hypothetical protein